MKLSSIMCASLLALAAAAFVAGGASAATIKTTKSNTFKIGTEAGTTEADCTKKGGTVTDGRDGKTCTLPEGQPADATTVKSSKSNSQE